MKLARLILMALLLSAHNAQAVELEATATQQVRAQAPNPSDATVASAISATAQSAPISADGAAPAAPQPVLLDYPSAVEARLTSFEDPAQTSLIVERTLYQGAREVEVKFVYQNDRLVMIVADSQDEMGYRTSKFYLEAQQPILVKESYLDFDLSVATWVGDDRPTKSTPWLKAYFQSGVLIHRVNSSDWGARIFDASELHTQQRLLAEYQGYLRVLAHKAP